MLGGGDGSCHVVDLLDKHGAGEQLGLTAEGVLALPVSGSIWMYSTRRGRQWFLWDRRNRHQNRMDDDYGLDVWLGS